MPSPELTALYRQERTLSIEAIRRGLAAGDYEAASQAAHKLRPGASVMGEHELAGACHDLEWWVRAGSQTDDLAPIAARFEAAASLEPPDT